MKDFGKSHLTVGGLFAADIQAMNYAYGRTSSLGYYASFGLGAFGKYAYTINEKNNLSASLQIPLFYLMARSPYLVNDDEFIENTYSHSGFKTFMAFIGDGNFVTWNRLQTFDLDLKYTHSLNRRWNLGAAYLFEFVHAVQPQNLLSYRQSLNLSASYCF